MEGLAFYIQIFGNEVYNKINRTKGVGTMFKYDINEDAYLKLLDLSDVHDLFALTDRSRDTLREWLPFVDGVQTVKDTEAFVKKAMQQYADNDGIQAGIYYDGQLAVSLGIIKSTGNTSGQVLAIG